MLMLMQMPSSKSLLLQKNRTLPVAYTLCIYLILFFIFLFVCSVGSLFFFFLMAISIGMCNANVSKLFLHKTIALWILFCCISLHSLSYGLVNSIGYGRIRNSLNNFTCHVSKQLFITFEWFIKNCFLKTTTRIQNA